MERVSRITTIKSVEATSGSSGTLEREVLLVDQLQFSDSGASYMYINNLTFLNEMIDEHADYITISLNANFFPFINSCAIV